MFMAPEALEKVIIMVGMCPVCLFKHDDRVQCRDKNDKTGKTVTCHAGCKIQGKPVRFAACKHGAEARKKWNMVKIAAFSAKSTDKNQ